MDHETPTGCRRIVLSVLLIVGLMLACGGVSLFAIDRICVQTFSERLPIYPGASVVSERHNNFASFGIGETILTLHSSDPVDTVKDWYSHTVGEYMYNAGRSPSIGYKITRGEWAVDPDDIRGGSAIYLHGVCAS